MTIYCFDGTSECGEGHHGGTNVLRLARIMRDPMCYVGGVGNPVETSGIGSVVGIAFGYGGQDRLKTALDHLIATYADDAVIDIIGFSRGAAIAIEFMHRAVAWARSAGHQDIRFRFVALMDTVFSFGLPNDIDLHYHHAIPHDVPVAAFYHAIALHETRAWFPVTSQPPAPNVSDYKQYAFKGAHADIGGGYRDRSLSNIVLNWFIEGAQAHGLVFNDQLPVGQAYATAFETQLPVKWEYYKSDPTRLPFRENKWFFAQAPRWRVVKDYRQKPHPRVFKYMINLSPYQKQNGVVVDPAKDYKMYNKKRRNGKPILIAEHTPLSLQEKIAYNEPIPLDAPRKGKRKTLR